MAHNFDELAYLQWLKTLSDAIDSNADPSNPDANTVIQYFDAPFDTMTLTASIQAYINGSTINTSASDKVTLTASMTPTTSTSDNAVWDGGSSSEWLWGANGVWDAKSTATYTLTLPPVIYQTS